MDKNAWPRAILHKLDFASRHRLFWVTVRSLISVVLLAALVYLAHRYRVGSLLQHADPLYLGLGFLCYIACQLAAAVRWHALLRLSGFTPPFWDVLRANVVGIYASNFLPGVVGGDAIRPIVLFGTATIHKPQLYASVVFERICGISSIAVLASFGAAWLGVQGQDWRYMLVAAVIAAGVLGLVLAAHITRRVRFEGDTWWARLQRSFSQGTEHFLRYTLTLRMVAVGLGMSLVFQLCYIAMLWCFLEGLQADVPLLSLVLAAPLSWLASMTPISINGLGVREGTLVVILTRFGAPQTQVTGAALLGLVPTFLISAIGAVWSLRFFDRHHLQSSGVGHE